MLEKLKNTTHINKVYQMKCSMCIGKKINREVRKDLFGIESDDEDTNQRHKRHNKGR